MFGNGRSETHSGSALTGIKGRLQSGSGFRNSMSSRLCQITGACFLFVTNPELNCFGFQIQDHRIPSKQFSNAA
jgi:hypothetical protein